MGVIILVSLIIERFVICEGINCLFNEIRINLLGEILNVCFVVSFVFNELLVKRRCDGVIVIFFVGFFVLIKMCDMFEMFGR